MILHEKTNKKREMQVKKLNINLSAS